MDVPRRARGHHQLQAVHGLPRRVLQRRRPDPAGDADAPPSYGAMIMMHAENGIAIDVLVQQALARGETDPKYHGSPGRPPLEARGHAPGDRARQRRRQRAAVHRAHVGRRGARTRSPRRAHAGPQRVRRDVPAVPVPDARGAARRARLRGRQVGVLARRCARKHDRTTSADLWKGLRMNELAIVSHRPLPVLHEGPEGARHRQLRRRSPTASAASSTGWS